MPRIQRRQRRAARWTPEHILQLETGFDFFGNAWGREHQLPNKQFSDEVLEDIRRCWRAFRLAILVRYEQAAAACRPWAWWRFDSPEPRKQDEPEWQQLLRLGIVSHGQAKLAFIAEHNRRLRSLNVRASVFEAIGNCGWWLFISPVPRDESVSELTQLIRDDLLTDEERKLLAAGEIGEREVWIWPKDKRDRFTRPVLVMTPKEVRLVDHQYRNLEKRDRSKIDDENRIG